jgi:hypothetical protein
MSTQPTRVFLKAMLIFPPGTTVNNLNVGSWWSGRSLFYQDYKDFKNTTIGNNNNLSEILEKIEEQLVKWDLLEKCDERDKSFSHLAHISVEKNWKIFWPKLIPMFDRRSTNKQVGFKLHSVFTIPRDTVDNFITILWKSIRKHRLLMKPNTF